MAQTADLPNRKKQSFKIFDEIAKTYDLLNHTLSFGIDIYWRWRLRQKLPEGIPLNVLDLATGTGDVAISLTKSKRVGKVLGMDLSTGMMEVGKKKVSKKGLTQKISFQVGDGNLLPLDDARFNAVTLSFGIRNFSNPQKSLTEIHRVLRPGGRALIMEFGLPKNIFIRLPYLFYFRHLLPAIGKIVSKHTDAYDYLNKTVEDFPYGDDFANWMKEAGFQNVQAIPLTAGINYLYIGDKA